MSLDWSDQKWGPTGWAKSQPMDCEERLFTDALNIVAQSANPGKTKAWVYRNSAKALPWFKTVREKLANPLYAPWFLAYGPPSVNGTYFSPPCDTNFDPPLCSNLYHDSTQSPDYARMPRCPITGDCSVQVPGFPSGDGNCSAPGCNVGGVVPVGEYIFDPRAWNTSIGGQTLGQWWVDDYLFGARGAENSNVTGFYFDDNFSEAGCSELDSHQLADLGLSKEALAAASEAYSSNMEALYKELTLRGAYTEQQFTKVSSPSTHAGACEKMFHDLCPAPPAALFVDFNDDTPELSMAVYLLARGEYGCV